MRTKFFLVGSIFCASVSAQGLFSPPEEALKHGADLYVNYCSGCHSLQYFRYEAWDKDLHPLTSLSSQEAQTWFGMQPPDLTLMAQIKGRPWLKDFLLGFYPDPSRPFGVNNHYAWNTAMPNALNPLQQKEAPKAFAQSVDDLLLFLDYVSAPYQYESRRLGIWVLGYFFLLGLLLYLLKCSYWEKSRFKK